MLDIFQFSKVHLTLQERKNQHQKTKQNHVTLTLVEANARIKYRFKFYKLHKVQAGTTSSQF